MPKYSGNVGKKFNEDGSAREFPGNTIICHVPHESPTFRFLLQIREELQQQPWAKKYAFLPPSSYHMTVFEGVCHQVRKRHVWPKSLPLDASLEDVDRFFIKQWDKIEEPTSIEVKYGHMGIGGTIGIRVQPTSPKMNQKIRVFRNLLAETMEIRTPAHDWYGFHISFAYLIEKLTLMDQIKVAKYIFRVRKRHQRDFGILQFTSPELCFFADMTNFAHSRSDAKRNSQD